MPVTVLSRDRDWRRWTSTKPSDSLHYFFLSMARAPAGSHGVMKISGYPQTDQGSSLHSATYRQVSGPQNWTQHLRASLPLPSKWWLWINIQHNHILTTQKRGFPTWRVSTVTLKSLSRQNKFLINQGLILISSSRFGRWGSPVFSYSSNLQFSQYWMAYVMDSIHTLHKPEAGLW